MSLCHNKVTFKLWRTDTPKWPLLWYWIHCGYGYAMDTPTYESDTFNPYPDINIWFFLLRYCLDTAWIWQDQSYIFYSHSSKQGLLWKYHMLLSTSNIFSWLHQNCFISKDCCHGKDESDHLALPSILHEDQKTGYNVFHTPTCIGAALHLRVSSKRCQL